MSTIGKIVLISLLFASIKINAQDILVLTLNEAQQTALDNSKDVVLASIEVDKAKAQVMQAMSALLPQVNGKLTYTQYGHIPQTVLPDEFVVPGGENTTEFVRRFNINSELSASQVLFNGVFLVGVQAANAFISIVEHRRVLTEESILDNVKRSYYQVLAANENIKVLEKNITNLGKLKRETSALYKNGFAEEIDVDRLQLSLNNLNTQLDQATRQVTLTEAVLKFQMGIDIYQPIQLVGALKDYMEEINYNLPEKADFNKRTEISFFNVREKVNEYNVKRYKSAYYPNILAFGSIAVSPTRDKFNFFRSGEDYPWYGTQYFGFEINVPIWDSFGKKGQVQYARLDLQRIQTERDKFFESLDLQYETSKDGLIKAKEELDYAGENIQLAEKIYNVSKIKYKEGVGSSLEMTNAERDLYASQANKIMAIYNLLIAKADIDKALGIYE